nr:hypothetical protein [Bifidobacterium bifidum]
MPFVPVRVKGHSHPFRYRHIHRRFAGELHGGPFNGAAFGPGSEHRRDVAERLALEYLPAGDPAGIKAQIARKEEEIDQLRQTVAGLRRRLEELEDGGRERNQAG